MSLPLGGVWPPRPYSDALAEMETWNAWYVGDTATLSAVYGGSATVAAHPAQMAGGLVGAAARMFWGRPATLSQQRHRMHMPVAADLCRTSASLLFAEPPTFGVPTDGGNDAAKTRIDRILNTASMHSALLESAEVAAAIGGSYQRLVWDKDVADHVMLDIVDADRAIPTFRWGQLTAVTFWDDLPKIEGEREDAVWRHLERHETGVILHGLYKGTTEKLGMMMPLDAHPATASYAPLVDADGGIPTNVKGLTAGYVPNARPMPQWRKRPGLCELGKPDLAGVEPLMDFIDETWSSLARDVRLAKSRLIVPEYMLASLGKGAGQSFDTDQEIFTPLAIAPNESGSVEITPQQFAIRLDDHLGAINGAFREVLRAVGYSPLTLGLPDDVAATATEVHAREKDSLQTRGSKIRHYTSTLGTLGATLIELDAVVFKTGATVSEALDLEWPDGARDSQLVRAQTVAAMGDAGSLATKVRIMQPDLDNDAVTQEVEAIMAEQGMAVPDPTALP